MDIEAHIIAFNERDIIRLTVEHYKSFCRRVIIYDNYSTDDTRDIAEAAGAEVKMFGIPGVLDDKEYLKVKNHCWKGSTADYVIVCDTDEILFNAHLINSGTIIKTQGWSIWDEGMPKESFTELLNGVVDDAYSKSIIFSPKLKEIGYIYGCHECKPKGDIKYGNVVLPIFHYHNIGGVERIIKRHALYELRRSENNKRWGMGRQYAETAEFKRKEWHECISNVQNLSSLIENVPQM